MTGRPRKEWEQFIGEVARDIGVELLVKTLKKTARDRDQYRKCING